MQRSVNRTGGGVGRVLSSERWGPSPAAHPKSPVEFLNPEILDVHSFFMKTCVKIQERKPRGVGGEVAGF